MIDKYIKSCSPALSTGEMPTKMKWVHPALTRMAIIKKRYSNHGKRSEDRRSLMHSQGGLLATMEICVAFSQKMNIVTTMWPLSGRAARGSESHHRDCVIHNSQEISISLRTQTDNGNALHFTHTHNGVLFSHIRNSESSVKWMELKNKSREAQSQKDEHHTFFQTFCFSFLYFVCITLWTWERCAPGNQK